MSRCPPGIYMRRQFSLNMEDQSILAVKCNSLRAGIDSVLLVCAKPVCTKHWFDVGPASQRLRRWPNIEPARLPVVSLDSNHKTVTQRFASVASVG